MEGLKKGDVCHRRRCHQDVLQGFHIDVNLAGWTARDQLVVPYLTQDRPRGVAGPGSGGLGLGLLR